LIQQTRCVFVHAREQVSVNVQSEADLAVTQALGDHLRTHSRLEQLARVAMAQRMEVDVSDLATAQ
jgi:hypothetical protein